MRIRVLRKGFRRWRMLRVRCGRAARSILDLEVELDVWKACISLAEAEALAAKKRFLVAKELFEKNM